MIFNLIKVKTKKTLLNEERKLRNISDYIFDCTSRLLENAELLKYISKHKGRFIEKIDGFDGKTTMQTIPFILSLVDVYSRDSIIILGNILDEDKKTSSLFTLVEHIQDVRKKKKYSARLKLLKKNLNQTIQDRGNYVAHFNTKLNIFENGRPHINGIAQFHSAHLRKVTLGIETFFWDIKEELSIEGLFVFTKGRSITRSFAELIGKWILPIK